MIGVAEGRRLSRSRKMFGYTLLWKCDCGQILGHRTRHSSKWIPATSLHRTEDQDLSLGSLQYGNERDEHLRFPYYIYIPFACIINHSDIYISPLATRLSRLSQTSPRTWTLLLVLSKDTAKVSPIEPVQDGVQGKDILSLDAMDVRPDVEPVVPRLSASPSSYLGVENETRTTTASTPDGMRSSPPTLIKDVATETVQSNGPADDSGVKSDSEAETIVLPGKDGHSPSKIRKSIKHEDKSEDEEMGHAPDVEGNGERTEKKNTMAGDDLESNSTEANVATSTLGKRKRSKHDKADENGVKKDGISHHSSGLSSVPTSPLLTTRSALPKHVASGSDSSRSQSPDSHSTSTVRTKAKSDDRLVPHGKHYASGSGDESEVRRSTKQRSSDVNAKQGKESRSSHPPTKPGDSSSRKRTRSASPLSRGHRRSASTQLPSKSTQGLSHKKKRVPAPLLSTEYPSDESSASEGSHPRSSRRHLHLAAPTTGESAISPAKIMPHRKHINASGQTLLARACQSGKLELVKQRYDERPGDLNESDNAKNTPLHTASIAGLEEIVQFLLKAGCNVDPVNDARDTPLHDAIDNGHLDVVKLLLDAGANPRKPNGKGEHPYDLVDDDTEEADGMREVILAAKNKSTDRRYSDDEQMNDHTDARSNYMKGSPRQTSPMHNQDSAGPSSRRNATTRSIKTSDSQLYVSLTTSELRKAAGLNDSNTLATILDVHNGKMNDPETLIIAAKAGHADIISLILGFGGFNPDPMPLETQPPESATPILAAIGRENLEIINFFLNQPEFDPTRIVNGETYYEIARRRAGSLWKEEVTLLKEAYDSYKKTHKSPHRPRSPVLRRDGREVDRDNRKAVRKDEHQTSRSHKRSTSSPKAKESESSKLHSHPTQRSDPQNISKKGSGRSRREGSYTSAVLSDRETTPLGPPKQKSHIKRTESDVAGGSETETTSKPRRKLVSGREIRGERELQKQRRPSGASTTSSVSTKERMDSDSPADKSTRKTSPALARVTSTIVNAASKDVTSDARLLDKEKTRSLKRDDSKDRLSAIRGESPVKRPRKSETPPRSATHDSTTSYDADGGPQKRRKLESDGKAGPKSDSASGSSPDNPRTPGTKNNSSSPKPKTNSGNEKMESTSRPNPKRIESPERSRHQRVSDESTKRPASTGLASEKTKGTKTAGTDLVHDRTSGDSAARLLKVEQQKEMQRLREVEEQAAKTRREKEEAEAREKAELEEKEELERVEEAKRARIAREEAAKEEELKRQQEEDERRERQRREDAEAQSREQEKQKALYLEQETKRREDQERRRAQALEQQRAERARLEKEKRLERLATLPLALRWLESENDIKTPQCANMFRIFEGYRYDTIQPDEATPFNCREQWMLNTNVALLLGEKDIQLSRYTAWERVTVSDLQKVAIWRTENGLYSLQSPMVSQISKYFPTNERPMDLSKRNKALFLNLNLFFVKVSEFMFVVPNFPHLRNVEMSVKYRELEIDVSIPPRRKWLQDPDRDANHKFIPGPVYYCNGDLLRKGEQSYAKTSTTSFGERRAVVQPGTFKQIPRDHPDYQAQAKLQGLLPEYQGQPDRVNGQSSGTSGITPPSSDKSKSINGGSPQLATLPALSNLSPELPNGTSPADEAMDVN